MGKGASVPDPYTTANAQGNLNYQNAQQNLGFGNANVVSPYGSSTWEQSGWQPIYNQQGAVTGYSPRYTQNIQLSPGEEALRKQNEQIRTGMGNIALQQTGRLARTYATDMNTQGLQNWQAAAAPGQVQKTFADVGGPQRSIGSGGDIRQDQAPTDRQAVEQAMMARYQQDAQQRAAAQDAQLAARGMAPGSQMYGQVQQGRDRANTDALNQAYLASGQESRAAQEAYNQAQNQRFTQGAAQGQFANEAQNQAYNQAMQRAAFGNQGTQQEYQMGADWAAQLNQLRQNQFVERQQLRDQPLKEAMTMAGFSGPNTPTFSPWGGSSMGNVDLMGAIYNSANMKNQASANRMSGIANLLGGVAGMLPWSDRRLKTAIRPLPGRTLAGVPLYAFTYRQHKVVPKRLWGTRHVGVMADEAASLHPDAVRRHDDGYDRVNYELLNERDATWPRARVAAAA